MIKHWLSVIIFSMVGFFPLSSEFVCESLASIVDYPLLLAKIFQFCLLLIYLVRFESRAPTVAVAPGYLNFQ